MAFQALINAGGSECSTGNTPLNQLLKQQSSQDSSLHNQLQQQSGAHRPTTSLRQHQHGSSSHTASGQSDADRFYQQQSTSSGNGGGGSAGAAFDLNGLRRELMHGGNQNIVGSSLGDGSAQLDWVSQYNPTSQGSSEFAIMEEQLRRANGLSPSSDLSADYWQSTSTGPSGIQQQQQQSQFNPGMNSMRMGSNGGIGMGMGMGGISGIGGMSMMNRSGMMNYGGGMGGGGSMMMMNQGMISQQQQQSFQETTSKGKERFVELDDAEWQSRFAQAEGSTATEEEHQTETLAATLDQISSDTINALQGHIDATESDAQLMDSLESTWKNLESTLNTASISDNEMAQWEAQYGSQFSDLNGDSGLADDFALSDFNSPRTWTKENVDGFLANTTPYPFSASNDYLTHPDAFAEGQRLLSIGAPLSQAALAFEAACQRDPSRAEAWRAAGETWSADEREAKGIRALEKAVACGGKDGVGAWMSLAVAYVNEGQELRALATLERWLSLAYPSISLPPTLDTPSSPWDGHNRAIDLFLGAARAGANARVIEGDIGAVGEIDPDVQVGLGVLFYSNSDYERAKDCFEAALSVRPNDFLLWNRLGATLANGGLPEEAIDAYRKALDLRPTFTRATYNLGVSCLNIGCYKEAAEHLLAAIEGQKMREDGKGKVVDAGDPNIDEDGSANLWQTLRRAFLCMERHDLAELSHVGSDVNVFRAEFDF